MNKKFLSTIREELLSFKEYSIEQPGNLIKLNQNESPYDIPGNIKQQLLKKVAFNMWNRYPDLSCNELISAGAEFYGVEKGSVFPAKGSNEILFSLFYTLSGRGKTILITEPSYSMYPVLTQRLRITVKSISLEKNFNFPAKKIQSASMQSGTGLVMLCSPNNPTGNTIQKKELEEILSSSSSYVAVDEAYAEFSNQNFIPLIKKYKNLLIIRTMSKAFGMASLRIGWLIGNPEFINIFKKSFLPYHIDTVSQTIAAEAMQSVQIETTVKKIIKEREYMYRKLSNIKKLKVFPSQANFILIEPEADAGFFLNKLRELGILVRNVSNYKGLNNHLRISIGTQKQNSETLQAIKYILESCTKNENS